MSLPYGSVPLSGSRTITAGYTSIAPVGYTNISSSRVLPATGTFKAAMPAAMPARVLQGGVTTIAQPMALAGPVTVASQATVVASERQLPIGSQIPSVELDCGFPPEKVNMAERTRGKRVILVGLPGAFTPT